MNTRTFMKARMPAGGSASSADPDETDLLSAASGDLPADLTQRAAAGERLSAEDALRLYESNDLFAIGALADLMRRKRHGDRAFYVYNQHINYTNICINRCRFCAFARDREEEGAYTWNIDDVRRRIGDRLDEPIHEIHMVGGLNPSLPFGYYIDLLKAIHEIRPGVTIKAFTAVEIDHLSKISGLTLTKTLDRLRKAGLGMLPGGGAEVLCGRIHKELFPRKISGDRWITVMRAVHQAGLTANATLLYGHIETAEERVRHLVRLRELQDETGGFSAFIPLAFHPENTRLNHIPPSTAMLDLKTIAVSRLMLDNIPHIKAYWVMLGPKLAQTALHFGADDLDGTIVEEKITHDAGASSPRGLKRDNMERLITSAGFTAVERDSFYRALRTEPPPSREPMVDFGPAAEPRPASHPEYRLTPRQALDLLRHKDLLPLGRMAHARRMALHPADDVTFVVDRNINYTNICVSGCRFCAFYQSTKSPDGYVITREDLSRKIRETLDLGGTQILLQGGMNPDLKLDWYENLLRFIHREFQIHVHGFSPPEIAFVADAEGCADKEVLERLMAAGLDSMPGGGAEILADAVRRRVSPGKCGADRWLSIMKTAHRLGMRTTATMMFGHLENDTQIMEHLDRLRQLQDETGGFTAFIPWTFQPKNTRIRAAPRTAVEYLRVLAVSRLFLDNFPNIQASWVTQGDKIGQTALRFGANDLGSTMIEENVVAAAGVRFRLSREDMIRLIHEAGFSAVQRDCFYSPLTRFPGPA